MGGELDESEEPLPEEEQSAVLSFLGTLLADPAVELPAALALDLGVIEGRGWAVVEANAAWGAGIYQCDPDQVLDVLLGAVRRPTT